MRLPQNLAAGVLCLMALAAASAASGSQSTAYLAPPQPAKILKIPAGSPIAGLGVSPTATLTFQSALSAAPRDRLDG